MLASFTIDVKSDENIFPWGHELIYRNGQYVGYVTSAAYGFTVGSPVVMGYIDISKRQKQTSLDSYFREGRYEVEIDGHHYPAEISLVPLYDPRSERINM